MLAAVATRAGIYARISSDPTGRGLGVARQEADCRRLAQDKDWHVAHVYVDNDISATSGKRRPEYEQLLDDLDTRRITAVCVWDLDRLHRRPIELERFLDLADRRDVALASVGGEVDLATVQGRLVARLKGAVARAEAEQIGRRVSRKLVEKAEAGAPHGRRAYGYRRVAELDDHGRRRSRDEVDEDEAAVVIDIAKRLISGDSLRSIVAELNGRGVPSPNGGQWRPVQVRHVVTRKRNVALRVHRGQVIGPAAWPPILDCEMFDAVQAVLADPARKTTVGAARRHLLSGIARCGPCGQPTRVAHIGKHLVYRCTGRSCVSRDRDAVDDLVVRVVLGRLSMTDAAALFADDDEAVREARQEAAQLRARLDGAADQYAEGRIDAQQLSRITERLRPRLTELEAGMRPAPTAPLAEGLIGAQDLRVAWEAMPLARQRAVIDMLMTVHIDRVAQHGVTTFDPSSVRVEWKADTAVTQGER